MVGSVDDDVNGGEKPPSLSSESCSICLDLVVADNGERSVAKLQCGHMFHLDCIGSAFNMKGSMQCPNCRNVEDGRWLYANNSARSPSDFLMNEWTSREDPFELNYFEMPFGVHWCPFSGLTGVHSSFGEVESPQTIHHDMLGNALIAEHITAHSLGHSPISLVRITPIGRASSNLSENADDPNFSHRRNGQPGHNEMYNTRAFPALNVQYQSWAHRSHPFPANRSHLNGSDQASVPPTALRSTRVETDAMTRSGPFVHPFLYGHGSVPRGTSVHPGSNTRLHHERIQFSHASHRPQQPPNNPLLSSILPGVRRFNGSPRGLPLSVPPIPHADRQQLLNLLSHSGSSGRHPHEVVAPVQWERDHFPVFSFDGDSGWGSSQHASASTDPNNRLGNFWQRRH